MIQTSDSVPVKEPEPVYGLLLSPEEQVRVDHISGVSFQYSCIVSVLILLFCIIGFKFRENRKYLSTLFTNLIDIRLRNNVFDETVRETSFLLLLISLWCCSAGLILYEVISWAWPSIVALSPSLPEQPLSPLAGVGLCVVVALAYTGFMAAAYLCVGIVFTDREYASLWLKGHTSSQALMSFLYLPLALLFISYPGWLVPLAWSAAVIFILFKIIFISNTYRIFFSQFSSWVLFLYYLCSLEIVPLVLTYLAAVFLRALVG